MRRLLVTLSDREKAMVSIAMRNKTFMEYTHGNLTILVSAGGGPWGQAMICGAVVNLPHWIVRKWCRSVDELQEFLEGFA